MLFWVSISYNIIRNILDLNKHNDIFLTVSFCLLGFGSLYLCMKGFSKKSDLWILILKLLFYIQFYHYGYIFKNYFEKRLLKLNKIIVCSVCILINVILIVIFGVDKIIFASTSNMNSFNSWYLPLITSFTGIIFYYEVMEFLSRKIGQKPIIDFISRNTFVIMEIHLLFANIPNFYIYCRNIYGSAKYADFNIVDFKSMAWFINYNSSFCLLGFFCGLIGSLIIALLIEKIKNKICNSGWYNKILDKLTIVKENMF